MSVEVYKSTNEASKSTVGGINLNKVPIGCSIFIKFEDCKEHSLRSQVSRINGYGERIFKVVKHKKEGFFEVACIGNFIDFAEKAKSEYTIVESSTQAKAAASQIREGKQKLPFDELAEGKSFIIPFALINEKTLRVYCSTYSTKLNKKFICFKHEELQLYEVYRKPKTVLTFYDPSPEALAKANEFR